MWPVLNSGISLKLCAPVGLIFRQRELASEPCISSALSATCDICVSAYAFTLIRGETDGVASGIPRFQAVDNLPSDKRRYSPRQVTLIMGPRSPLGSRQKGISSSISSNGVPVFTGGSLLSLWELLPSLSSGFALSFFPPKNFRSLAIISVV